MDNQHNKIIGYRDLTQAEIDLMNDIKTMGLRIDALIENVNKHLNHQLNLDSSQSTNDRFAISEPFTWMYDSKREFQKALMFLTRAVAQPMTF